MTKNEAIETLLTYIKYAEDEGFSFPAGIIFDMPEIKKALDTEENTKPVEAEWCDTFCSVCGRSKYNFFTVIRAVDGTKSAPCAEWKFCPNCGAKMIKEGY